jgi:predicted DNA-binding ribbon-helix-helix protein
MAVESATMVRMVAGKKTYDGTAMHSFRMTDEAWEAVKAVAATDGLSASELVRRVVLDHLAERGHEFVVAE